MNTDINSIVGVDDFLKVFDRFVEKYSLKDKIEVDHICYKCDSNEMFNNYRREFEKEKWIYQSIISQRRIALIKFKKPVETKVGLLDILELSDQKPNNSQIASVDHIEFTLKDMSLNNFLDYMNSFNVEIVKDEKPHHTTYNMEYNSCQFKITLEKLIEKIKREEML